MLQVNLGIIKYNMKNRYSWHLLKTTFNSVIKINFKKALDDDKGLNAKIKEMSKD